MGDKILNKELQELDNKLYAITKETRDIIKNRLEPSGLKSHEYHDETIEVTSFILDSMDKFREEIISYLNKNT